MKDINRNPYFIMALGWGNCFMAVVCFASGMWMWPIGAICGFIAVGTIFRLLNLEEEK